MSGRPHQKDVQREAVAITLGRRIKERRVSLGLTQVEVGGLIGISHQQVQKYESGFNNLTVIRAIEFGYALNVSLEIMLQDVLGIAPSTGKCKLTKKALAELEAYLEALEAGNDDDDRDETDHDVATPLRLLLEWYKEGVNGR